MALRRYVRLPRLLLELFLLVDHERLAAGLKLQRSTMKRIRRQN